MQIAAQNVQNWQQTTRKSNFSLCAGIEAFYDTNVLNPAKLWKLLLHLALTGLFRAQAARRRRCTSSEFF